MFPTKARSSVSAAMIDHAAISILTLREPHNSLDLGLVYFQMKIGPIVPQATLTRSIQEQDNATIYIYQM